MSESEINIDPFREWNAWNVDPLNFRVKFVNVDRFTEQRRSQSRPFRAEQPRVLQHSECTPYTREHVLDHKSLKL